MQIDVLIAVFTADGFRVDRELSGETKGWFDEELRNSFQICPDRTLYNFGFAAPNADMSASMRFLKSIAEKFIDEISHDSDLEITRRAKPADDHALLELLHTVPFAVGIEHVSLPWLRELWERLRFVFNEDVAAYPGSAAEYLRGKNSSLGVVGRVFFHLVEHKSEDYPFAFLATYSTGSAESVSHMPLKNALLEYKLQQDKLMALLSTVSKAADQSDFISDLVESGELFSPLRFTAGEAYIFLREISLYEDCGIICRMPDWWKKKGNTRLAVSIGDKEPAGVGLEAIMAFRPEIFLGDVRMTREEIEALLSQANGLSFIKGKWIEVDHDKLKSVLDAFDQVNGLSGMTLAEALRVQMGIKTIAGLDSAPDMEVTNGQWLSSVRSRLLHPGEMERLDAGDDFKAALRAYQQDGFDWLHFMGRLGFGALLADDMGLGKTVQILALLEYLRQNANIKTLLIIPASLLHNWQKESSRFTPKLRSRVVHTGNVEFSLDEADLFITTYGMITRLDTLRETQWDLVILDEAQAIKNAAAKQTQAVKQIHARGKIAVTGTPIENRLSDLWSISDFLNKGLLGTHKEFSAYAKGLKDNPSGYAHLRDAVSPFILRRLKTDKAVISDLPDKVELKAFTTLTKKQTVLYNALVKELSHALEDASGIARKGLVLASIMKFKQICNHPDQYLGQQEFKSTHSGKFDKLAEICSTIREKREQVLVFTQFKEIVKPLAGHLETIFGQEGLILHGGTAVKKRGELVERFNGAEYMPFMVLSLKAGGVGLNLTSANHVVHFDRWWNPAVENQATDRVFRIGQKKNVMVHKFVTAGTIEEKIDVILDEKQMLADNIIAASGENWITEMNDEELMSLLALEVEK